MTPPAAVGEVLLPCPFCGNADIDPEFSLSLNPDGSEHHEPGCMTCGATCNPEWWNRRAAVASAPSPPEDAKTDAAAMQDDLGALLLALGMGDHARPKSSHAVMLDAIQEVCNLRAKLAEAERKLAASEADALGAWRFVAAVFQAYDDAGWGCDIDGADIQEWGVKFGLLDVIDMAAESADETDMCHNCAGDCDTCYRFTVPLQVRVDAARGASAEEGP